MVLVEVVELVVDVDRRFDGVVDGELDAAWVITVGVAVITGYNFNRIPIVRTDLIILLRDALNVVGHDVEGYTEGKEDDSKDAEDDHGGSKGGHWSPSGQHLLLEFALLQFVDLFLDLQEIVL